MAEQPASATIRMFPPSALALITCWLVALVTFLPVAAAAHEYEIKVWFNWDSPQLDILIAAIDDPLIGTAIRDAIQSWEVGIDHLSPQLGSTIEFRTYWPAADLVPPAAFQPDIVVIPQGAMAAFAEGGGQGAEAPRCYAMAPLLLLPNEFYSVVAHEFGHCLGLAHVFEHGVEYSPAKDIMGSGSVLSNHACPSNLDVMALEMVYTGQTGSVTIAASEYFQSTC